MTIIKFTINKSRVIERQSIESAVKKLTITYNGILKQRLSYKVYICERNILYKDFVILIDKFIFQIKVSVKLKLVVIWKGVTVQYIPKTVSSLLWLDLKGRNGQIGKILCNNISKGSGMMLLIFFFNIQRIHNF